jgi:putative transposase
MQVICGPQIGRFPVQDGPHYLSLCRYVEANAVRAGLAERAADWPWCGAGARRRDAVVPMSDWPVERPRHWATLVNRPISQEELASLRTSVQRGRPYGEPDWVRRTARRLSVEFTLRPRGRPRKHEQ